MADLFIGDLDKKVSAGVVLDILDEAFENAATSWTYWLAYDAPGWLKDKLEDREDEFIALMQEQDEELIKSLKSYADAELVWEIDRA